MSPSQGKSAPAGAKRSDRRTRDPNGPVDRRGADGQGARVIEMQRRRLVTALVEVAGSEGLPAVTVGAVCARAGVSRRTFYEQFEDRDACLLAAVQGARSRLEAVVVPAYRGSGAWRERVRAAVQALLESFDADGALARTCVVETLRAGPQVLECRALTLTAVAEALDEGRAEASGTMPPLTAQGIVGGALAVIHSRLLERHPSPLLDLVGPLTAMIVHPYLGSASSEEELAKPATRKADAVKHDLKDPFGGLSIRFTYRTARVLATIATTPGASNRQISGEADIIDEGQTSRLLRRLRAAGLIENNRDAGARGEPNAWALTERGRAVHATLEG